jgi:hypothetical protein
MSENPDDIEKQRALGFIQKAVRSAERVLLTHPGETEGLTREARAQHIVLGDLTGRNITDISGDRPIVTVVSFVGLTSELVPLRSEDAATTDRLHRSTESTDSCE